jgi:hypothetical protein
VLGYNANTTHTTQHTPQYIQAYVMLQEYTHLPITILPSERQKHTLETTILVYICEVMLAPTILPNVPSATTSILSLAVKVHPSDRRSKIVDSCEVPCAEVCSPPWCIGGLPD